MLLVKLVINNMYVYYHEWRLIHKKRKEKNLKEKKSKVKKKKKDCVVRVTNP